MNLIPRGAGTGLSGGANAIDGSVIVSMEQMTEILEIDPQEQLAVVQPGVVNQSLIDAITDRLRLGKDLNWEELWKTVQVRVGAGYRDKFDDYIPPHKNLGAIFIMAYDKIAQN